MIEDAIKSRKKINGARPQRIQEKVVFLKNSQVPLGKGKKETRIDKKTGQTNLRQRRSS